MSTDFYGIPCTPPNQWELHLQPSTPDDSAERPPTVPRYAVTPQLQSLNFYADFYNEHHACCWPRTLLDTHIGQAAEAVSRTRLAETDSIDKVRLETENSEYEFDDSEHDHRDHEDEVRKTSMMYTQHVIQVAQQLFSIQQEKPPRAPHARRIVYHKAIPPVLRYTDHGDSLVYLLRGQIVLLHSCQRFHWTRRGEEVRDRGASNNQRECTHAQDADALARDVFPLFLIMAPSRDCAPYVDSESGSASEKNQWQSQPMALALESVTCMDSEPASSTHDITVHARSRRDNAFSDTICWCASYSTFTWLVNPFGNEHVSSLVRTNAAVSILPRRRSRSGLTTALPQKTKKVTTTKGAEIGSDGLSPLRLSFDIYATFYTSDAAKQHILAEIQTSHLYVPHVTQALRFSLGSSNDNAAAEVRREHLAQACARRPGQLMRLLDTRMKASAASPQCRKLFSETSAPEGNSRSSNNADNADTNSDFPSLKAPRHTEQAEVPRDRAEVIEVPCVRMALVGTLRTSRSVARERCVMPKGATLSAVLRRVPPPAYTDEDTNRMSNGSTDEHSVHTADWPLRVKPNRAAPGYTAIQLSPLCTLKDLANVLRQISE